MQEFFPNNDPEVIRKLIEERRKYTFLASSQWRIRWGMLAERHKLAADILFEYAYQAYERIMARFADEIRDGSLKHDGSRELEGQELLDYKLSDLLEEYYLLAGYALENILKGCLMCQHPEYVKDGKLDKQVTTHKLVDLCRLCNIPLSQEETNLLLQMTHQAEWGRYPVPK